MASVVIDGEKVEFEGDAPQTCREACELIDGYLSGQGLAIESVSVDGEVLSLEDASAREAYELIVFKSISPQAQLLGMCKQWEQGCSELAREMEALSGGVLRLGWSDAQAAVVALLEKLRPLIEGLGILQNFGKESGAGWSEGVTRLFEEALAAIDGVMTAIESRDVVALSDRLTLELAGRWSAFAEGISGEVIPALEGDLSV